MPDLTRARDRRLWQTQCIAVLDDYYRAPLVEAGIISNADMDYAPQALRNEFQTNRYANADVLYAVWGQRPRAMHGAFTPSRPGGHERA